ncbi:aminoglycoside adenylyltransferase [Actibacterium mucosum KCTC 23349]|uniref:Aminoglycoside adenylyltransferase n=1 Tax=Actibacterium mucosum KCTC 23349 TaxID=1454373 RepID=A0A037ZHC4_9RHOB|nr:GNAT family N-acetyltransferase [Actibacterium mucosum]KAJ55538.1 aminoglycoside adenylyltransferase [Actibacterium mucosum KCTC 23349]
MGTEYNFRKVLNGDLPLLATWRAAPHVRVWWDSDEPDSPAELTDSRVARFIVSLGDRPFAYMQDYTVHGWDGHHFFELPLGSRGIDQFIGLPDMVGKGHGPAFIAQRVADLFAAGAPVVATDPHPDNTRAIAAYEKAGFRAFGPSKDTPWGRILPMRADRS